MAGTYVALAALPINSALGDLPHHLVDWSVYDAITGYLVLASDVPTQSVLVDRDLDFVALYEPVTPTLSLTVPTPTVGALPTHASSGTSSGRLSGVVCIFCLCYWGVCLYGSRARRPRRTMASWRWSGRPCQSPTRTSMPSSAYGPPSTCLIGVMKDVEGFLSCVLCGVYCVAVACSRLAPQSCPPCKSSRPLY
jgi:hypothetical protein